MNDRERHRAACLPLRQSRPDILGGLDLALRNRTPPVERSIARRSGNQAVDVSEIKRLETNVPAGQHRTFRSHIFCHGGKYAVNLWAGATEDAIPQKDLAAKSFTCKKDR
jgi:hypothetical protein